MFLAHRSWQEKSSFIFQIKITSLWWGSVRLLSDKLLSYKPKEGMEIKKLSCLNDETIAIHVSVKDEFS